MLLGFAEESLCSVFRHRRCALVYELLHGGDLYRRREKGMLTPLGHGTSSRSVSYVGVGMSGVR